MGSGFAVGPLQMAAKASSGSKKVTSGAMYVRRSWTAGEAIRSLSWSCLSVIESYKSVLELVLMVIELISFPVLMPNYAIFTMLF